MFSSTQDLLGQLQYSRPILEVIGSQLTTQDQVVDDFGLGLPLLFKVHKIWSVDSQENN